ncbi:hypothetical protein L1Q56_sAgp1 [Bean latent virus]|uniref:Uncharacterized protein n=1 Tax=Bean latent virus TaxID=2703869 RepID=A0A6C0X297_9GEMI|nr:hypothetical protein L1Q56_sAgp1 [Bean latent virus]QIC52926.1 hypothetical protein [Bean latent virus]
MLILFNSKCLSAMPRGAQWRGPPRSAAPRIIRLVEVWVQRWTRPLLGLTGPCIGSPGYIGSKEDLTSLEAVKGLVRSSHLNSVMIFLMLVRSFVYLMSHVVTVLLIVWENVFVLSLCIF